MSLAVTPAPSLPSTRDPHVSWPGRWIRVCVREAHARLPRVPIPEGQPAPKAAGWSRCAVAADLWVLAGLGQALSGPIEMLDDALADVVQENRPRPKSRQFCPPGFSIWIRASPLFSVNGPWSGRGRQRFVVGDRRSVALRPRWPPCAGRCAQPFERPGRSPHGRGWRWVDLDGHVPRPSPDGGTKMVFFFFPRSCRKSVFCMAPGPAVLFVGRAVFRTPHPNPPPRYRGRGLSSTLSPGTGEGRVGVGRTLSPVFGPGGTESNLRSRQCCHGSGSVTRPLVWVLSTRLRRCGRPLPRRPRSNRAFARARRRSGNSPRTEVQSRRNRAGKYARTPSP